MPLPTRALVALTLAAALGACQQAGDRPGPLEPGDRFAVTHIDGAPAPAGLTFELDEAGRIAGQAPCNRYGGRLTGPAGAMGISDVVMTRRACAEPARNMAEIRFGSALGSVTAARRAAGGVVLSDVEGRERLRLARIGR